MTFTVRGVLPNQKEESWVRASVRVRSIWVAVLVCGGGSCAVGTSIATAVPLPDGRGYELVSPADKGGADVMASTMKTRIAPDGDAVVFSSLGAFGDPVGTGLEISYASVRQAGGWSTHSLTPRQEPQPWATAVSNISPSYDAFSEDLSIGVLLSLSSVTDEPNDIGTRNLYRRSDVLAPGAGAYALLTQSSSVQGSPTGNRPFVGGASSDFMHVLFQSKLNLVPEATPCPDINFLVACSPKLYEWDHGTVRLAGVLPNGQPATCPNGQVCSSPGRGAGAYGVGASISPGGSRVFFSSPVGITGLGTATTGLYMRENHESTVQINASERISGPDPGGPEAALFWGTAGGGSKVFFTSGEALTDAGGSGLYMYDASRPDTDPDNLTLLASSALGVIGISADGSFVYFLAQSQLVPGAPTDGPPTLARIFVWHDGDLRYVGAVDRTSLIDDIAPAIGGGTFAIQEQTARVTPDGRRLVLTARDGTYLGGYDHGARLLQCGKFGGEPCSEVYHYDYDANGGAGRLSCVSCNRSGASAIADASTIAEVGRSNTISTSYLNHPMSDDGSRVFFSSGEGLVPADDNGVMDAYEYDAVSGELHLLSTGQSTSDSFFMDATPSGDDVLIATRERLVGVDTDQAYDLYDVRVGGGISEQNPPPVPVECAGEDCLGTASAPGGEANPISVELDGGSGPGQVDELLGRLNGSAAVFHVHHLSDRVLRRLAAGKRATLRVSVSEAGAISVRMRGKVGGHRQRLGRARRRAAHGGVVALKLKLAAEGQAQLRQTGRLRVAVVVRYSEAFHAQRAAFTLTWDDGGRR